MPKPEDPGQNTPPGGKPPTSPGQDTAEGKGQTQPYFVKADFTDATGKAWTVGTVFTGDENAVAKAKAAGQIEQRPKPTPQ